MGLGERVENRGLGQGGGVARVWRGVKGAGEVEKNKGKCNRQARFSAYAFRHKPGSESCTSARFLGISVSRSVCLSLSASLGKKRKTKGKNSKKCIARAPLAKLEPISRCR